MAENLDTIIRNFNEELKKANTSVEKISRTFNATFTEAVKRALSQANMSADAFFTEFGKKVGMDRAFKMKLLFETNGADAKTALDEVKRRINDINAKYAEDPSKGKDDMELKRLEAKKAALLELTKAYDDITKALNKYVSDEERAAKSAAAEAAKKAAREEREAKKAARDAEKEKEKAEKDAEKARKRAEKAKTDAEKERAKAEKAAAREKSKAEKDAAAAKAKAEKEAARAEAARLRAEKAAADAKEKAEKAAAREKAKAEKEAAREAEAKAARERRESERRARQERQEREERNRRMRQEQQAAQKMNRSFMEMLPAVQRLAGALGLAFSVQGLVNFARKLVEVRGTFEMQFVAMKQVIGDTDAATRIWDQTMQQALKSPFKAMELTGYVKKLAAYRIETDKLFDTTKRLADVSAGLGVDMQRLILAYGQVKTANYLRASEVRQFTEAGVNIYGELAKYFSEIEGKAVGTAEVVERVTKRMVLFSDVEAIFKRMTDEGGAFFNMQEIQSETVRGQMMKLRDLYEQILNTIGKSADGKIRGFIDTMMSLLKNWREVAYTIKANVNWFTVLGGALLVLSNRYIKGATNQTLWFSKALTGMEGTLLRNTAGVRVFGSAIGGFNVMQRAAIVCTRTLQGAVAGLGATLRTIAPLLIFEAIVQVIRLITKEARELRELRKEIERIHTDAAKSVAKEIKEYDRLLEKLKETTEGSVARKEVLDEISSKYGKYLDFVVSETTKVEELAGAYDTVVQRMRVYAAERAREEQTALIGDKLQESYQEFLSKMKTGMSAVKEKSGSGKSFAEFVEDRISKDKSIKDESYHAVRLLKEYFGNDIVGKLYNEGYYHMVTASIERYIKEFRKLEKELEKTKDSVYGASPIFPSGAEEAAYEEKRQKMEEELAAAKKAYLAKLEKAKNTIGKKFQYDEYERALEKEFIEQQMRIIEKNGMRQTPEYDALVKKAANHLDAYENDYNERLKELLSRMSEAGEGFLGIDKDMTFIYRTVESTNDRLQQGTTQWNKSLVEGYRATRDSLKQLEKALAAGGDEEFLTERIEMEKTRLEAYEIAMRLRGLSADDDGSSKRQRQELETVSKMVSLLKTMHGEYEKLSKSAYGYARAEKVVRKSFEESFKAVFKTTSGIGQYIDMKTTDFRSMKGLAAALRALYDGIVRVEGGFSKFAKNSEKELLKAIDTVEAEAYLEVQVRVREDFARRMEEALSDYSLTLELKSLGIPEDAAKELFPDFEYTSLAKLQDLMGYFSSERRKVGLFSESDFEEYKKWADKVDKEIYKARKEKAQQYGKYLEKEYSERAKLEMQHARDVAFVKANISDSERRRSILSGIDRKFERDINDLNWKSFKESDFYIEMMDDITSLPREYTQMMLEKIDEVLRHPETMSTRAIKEAVNARKRVLEAQMELEPVDVMHSSLEAIRAATKSEEVGGKTWKATKENIHAAVVAQGELMRGYDEEITALETLQGELAGYEEALARLRSADSNVDENALRRHIAMVPGELRDSPVSELTDEEVERYIMVLERLNEKAEEAYNPADKSDATNALAVEMSERERLIALLVEELSARRELAALALSDRARGAVAAGQTAADVTPMIQDRRDALDASVRKSQSLKQSLDAFARFDSAFEKFNGGIASTVSAVGSMGEAMYDMFDALGGETDALTEGWKEFGGSMVGIITEALTMIPTMVASFTAAGVAINSAMGIIGLIAMAVQLVMQAVTAVSRLIDSGHEKEIEEQQKKIDALTRAYERLEKAIEKAWDTSSYMDAYERQARNLRAQMEAVEAQAAAERAKKNTDEERLRGYEDTIADISDSLEELRERSTEVFGGIGEGGYRDAAGEFVAAWKEAFLETGDGLDALREHFDEFLNEWFVKQATMRMAGAMLRRTFEMIDESVSDSGAGGAAVTESEILAIREEFARQAPLIADALEDLAGMWDLGGGKGSLSGLAAGIQGITEEQANVLEAYWNSVRAHTANIDGNVERIAAILGAGGAATNPTLQQMQLVEQNTKATLLLLQSATKSGHTLGGIGFKVFND